MRAWPPGFAAAFARRTGVAPLWILRLTVGAVDYYLSDQAITIATWQGGVTLLPWVAAWGDLREELAGSLDEIRIADMSVSLLVDIDAAPNAEDLALDETLEKSLCVLYLWDRSLDPATDPPQEINRFYVVDAPMEDPGKVELQLEDAASRLRQPVGEVVTAAAWPDADPDDIGKIVPIPFGTVVNLPPVALEAGVITTLAADIDAAQTVITVADPRGVTVGKQFSVGTERLFVTAASGQDITVTRGYGGTTAATHTAGDAVTEYRTSPFVFAASDRALISIDQVLCRRLGLDYDVTDLVARYTGAVADQYAGYGDWAVVVISQAQAEAIRARCGAELALTDPGHNHPDGVLVTSAEFQHYAAVAGYSGPQNPSYAYDGNGASWSSYDSATPGQRCDYLILRPRSSAGTPTRMRVCMRGERDSNSGTVATLTATPYVAGVAKTAAVLNSAVETTVQGAWFAMTDWDLLRDPATYVRLSTNATPGIEVHWARLREIWLEVEYDPGTTSGPSGLSLSGNSVADTAIGGQILVNCTAPDSLPAEAMAVLLSRVGVTAAVTVVGNLPAEYQFNGAVARQDDADRILTRMALQCRSWFRLIAGSPLLTVRPDAPTSARALVAVAVDDNGRRRHRRYKTPQSEIINTIDLRYDRDWSILAGDEAYRGLLKDSVAASVDVHGVRSREDLFRFDFVTSATLAASLLAFYLAAYGTRGWLHEIELYLDHADLEFGDGVTLAFSAGEIGQITAAGISPGDLQTLDRVRLTLRV